MRHAPDPRLRSAPIAEQLCAPSTRSAASCAARLSAQAVSRSTIVSTQNLSKLIGAQIGPRRAPSCQVGEEEGLAMDKSSKEDDAVAWHAVNALIQDAKSNFRGKQQEAFAFAIYNAIRNTDPSQIQNLRDHLRNRGIEVEPGDEARGSWVKKRRSGSLRSGGTLPLRSQRTRA